MQKSLKNFSQILLRNISGKVFKTVFSNKKIISTHKFTFSSSPNTNQSSQGLSTEEKQSLDYIESGVFDLLKSMPKCKLDKLNRTASLEDVGFDSLDIVELVIAVEEKFNITISDDDSVKIQTVQDLIQMFFNYHTGKVKKPEPITGPASSNMNNL